MCIRDRINSKQKILYINETIGHGTNLITGDYSVGASGQIIENGEFKYPVSEITIAGNFNEIFKNFNSFPYGCFCKLKSRC